MIGTKYVWGLAVLAGCAAGVPGPNAAPPSAAAVSVAEVEVPGEQAVSTMAGPAPHVRTCDTLLACLDACEGCSEVRSAEAKNVLSACSGGCPDLEVRKRPVTVPDELGGFRLGESLGAAEVRCSEMGGAWSASDDRYYEGVCKSALGPWGIPVDVSFATHQHRVFRVELSYGIANGERPADLVSVVARLFQESLGAPTYEDHGHRPQYSWMGDAGPYLSVLGDDASRTVSIWIKRAN
jgi:hypothetical protein